MRVMMVCLPRSPWFRVTLHILQAMQAKVLPTQPMSGIEQQLVRRCLRGGFPCALAADPADAAGCSPLTSSAPKWPSVPPPPGWHGPIGVPNCHGREQLLVPIPVLSIDITAFRRIVMELAQQYTFIAFENGGAGRTNNGLSRAKWSVLGRLRLGPILCKHRGKGADRLRVANNDPQLAVVVQRVGAEVLGAGEPKY